MGAMGIAMAGLNLTQGVAQGQVAKLNAKVQASELEQNARIASMNREEALRKGEEQSEQVRRQGKQIVGSQRASFGAQGIELSSGSALDIQGDTVAQAEIDAITIRNNAFREALGYKMQEQQLKSQAKTVKTFGKLQSNLSLLGGGIGAIGSAYQYSGRS